MTDHDWQTCRPRTRDLDKVPNLSDWERGVIAAAAARLWDTLDNAERRTWHSYHCLGKVNGYNRSVIVGIGLALRSTIAAEDARQAGNAAQVLDAAKKMGVKTFTPEPGQEITVCVIRVYDQTALGDDPLPGAAVRRTTVPCSQCGANCWSDPASYEPGKPTFVCMRCLNPSFNQQLDEMIAEARAKRLNP